MLTLQKTANTVIASVPTSNASLDDLLKKEWLLTNNRGGYAASTIVGCNTSRYHGLLIGSLNPPANRIVALANCMEMIISDGKVFDLSTFEFNEKFAPHGFAHVKSFHQDTGVHFDYQLNGLKLTKSIYLVRDTDAVAIVYDFTNVREPIEFVSRPFVGLRDFHSLQKSYALFSSTMIGGGLLIRHDVPGSCKLFLSCPSMKFEKDPQWWFNFVYRKDRHRGQDCNEDLWTPGFFKCAIENPARIVFWANLSASTKSEKVINTDIKSLCRDLQKHQHTLISAAKTKDEKLKKLCLAADAFITRRQTKNSDQPQTTTVLAGFPWFADWGRDALIALPGLLLSTGRFDEAKSVLLTFAKVTDKGMIPNRFDDRSSTAHFNSVDASLWFINAAFQYLNATNNTETFTQYLLPTIRWIVDSYHNGTRFGIHADVDGLITAGDNQTQLTWMDAKCDGIAFTPRYGKAVEINALWYNSLCLLAQFYTERDTETAKHYHSMADKVEAGFTKFWNDETGCLNDCILPDGSVDASLRPNQIFAVSLQFSPLSPDQQKKVVDVVRQNLLTPYGLRTLNPQDSRYKGRYIGPQRERDEAYHQGTAWPYLIGPFVSAWLKVNDFSRESKNQAAEFIEPLLSHLTEDACLGQVSEVFDGDPPQEPGGCVAQAWSVAELIRAYQLING